MRHIKPVGKPAAAQVDILGAFFDMIQCLLGGLDPLGCVMDFIKALLGQPQ